MPKEFLSTTVSATLQMGQQLARLLKPKDIVCLLGDLGCGKTVLTKGIAQGLGFDKNEVSSPTFTFLNIYEGKKQLYHFDLYRIEKDCELADIGLQDFLYGQGICVIEWADKLGSLMPKDYLKVVMTHRGDARRHMTFYGHGDRGCTILRMIKT